MKKLILISILLVSLLFIAASAFAVYQTCTFDNTKANVNCNLYQAGNTFCYYAMGAIANNPATAVQCDSSTIVCGMEVPANRTVRCSNTPSYVSGPDAQGFDTMPGEGQCGYQDCALNQVACSSKYYYRVCENKGGPCNEWVTYPCTSSPGTCNQAGDCIDAPTEVRSDLPGSPTFLVQGQGASARGNPVTEVDVGHHEFAKDSFQGFFESEFVQSLFGNERINATVVLNGERILRLGIVTEDGQVIEIKQPEIENPTVYIQATEDALLNIAASDNKLAELQNQLGNGGIKYEPVGLMPSIKFAFLNIINSIMSMFSPAAMAECSDSDGSNLQTRGTVSKGSVNFTDSCANNMLKEYICSNGQVSYTLNSCANGCLNGACQ